METLLAYRGLDMSGRQYSGAEIVEVVLTAAAPQTSIEQVCKTREAAPWRNTGRGVLEAQWELELVEGSAHRMLGHRLPKELRKEASRMAVVSLAQMLPWLARLGEEHLRTVRALQVGYPLWVQDHG